ncbi:hypothetical protein Mtc_0762 [Methanocella conradii HZ254]|uniref:Uncharacterized protein n=1 Tax=Methanocella conradii (strain DSM 24694 / JCM 17849 / CGMCC 1.5162 / HZ254) TaxID=1041930 RepID=H8I9A8_METCZ|nr:hypothetical protein [Methanocella conradii]AFC99526.1 hypothetical protein Mtc_0762 [Methanocella conradii HZ254]
MAIGLIGGMAMRLTSRNKAFIAGLLGFALLLAHFVFPATFSSLTFGYMANNFGVIVLSGLACGVVACFLLYGEGLAVVAVRSSAAGLAAGLMAMLAYFALAFYLLANRGLLSAAVSVLSSVIDLSPLFILVILSLALFSAVGGMACKLLSIAVIKLIKRKAA